MKNITITIEEFEALVAKEGWTHEVDVVDAYASAQMDDEDIPRGGWLVVSSKLGDITIEYTESYSYKLTDIDSFEVNTEGQSDIWTFAGVTIVDSDGDKMDERDLNNYFEDKVDPKLLYVMSALTAFMPVEFMDFESERDALEAGAIKEIQAKLEELEEQAKQAAQEEQEA